VKYPIVRAGVANFSNIPSFPPSTSFFLPLLFFFQDLQIVAEMHSLNSPIPNLLDYSPFPYFPKSVLSLDYSKPFVVTYEETMPLSIFSLWCPKFQPFTLNPAVFHLVTLVMLCYP
jgi:hypothetical protein